jgi:four helix bundle protein
VLESVRNSSAIEPEGGRGRVGEGGKKERLKSYRELRVYRGAFDAAMKVFELTKQFPVYERYSLVDQIRRSSRSVCANLAEAWRKRRYEAHFVAKLSDAESEAEETRVWLEFAVRCGYLGSKDAAVLDTEYDQIIAQLVRMISKPSDWKVSAPPG